MGYLSRLLVSLSLLSFASAIRAPSCSPNSKCPEDKPCCSAYGVCGAGAYCLGGCDPMSSFSLEACMARPTCTSTNYITNSLNGLQANTIYLGDASDVGWVTEGQATPYKPDNALLLTMAPDTSGTLLSSAHYVWYGKISATMRSSAGQGVVTAFIMMSDVKDEIDFEFVGSDLETAQSNFYWQGTKNYTNSKNLAASSTNTDWHTYTIDWQEDSLKWIIDGRVLRTLYKKDTLDPDTGIYKYPQTPSRIQLSLWPAGTTKNAPGTIKWAGGLINWNSPYMSNGYYYAQVKNIKVECADPPSGVSNPGGKSYEYTDLSGLQDSVSITNDNTILGGPYATGLNQDFTPKQNQGSGSGNEPDPTNVETVPGISGAGVRGDGGDPGSGFAPGYSGSGSGNYAPTPDGSGEQTFTQGLQGMATPVLQSKAATSSAFAILIAFIFFIAY